MTRRELETGFRKLYKGRNFMTPDFIEYVTGKDVICEIAAGRGIPGVSAGRMYGVTVARVEQGELVRDSDANDCFKSLTEAMEYAKNLTAE